MGYFGRSDDLHIMVSRQRLPLLLLCRLKRIKENLLFCFLPGRRPDAAWICPEVTADHSSCLFCLSSVLLDVSLASVKPRGAVQENEVQIVA